MIWSPDGSIVTNAHVVEGFGTPLKWSFGMDAACQAIS